MTEPQRDFKGIWIPKELWFSKDLTKTELLLFAEIDSLSTTEKGCYASNNYLSKFMGVSSSRISQMITSLVNKKYVDIKLIYAKDNPKQVVRRELYPINILSRGVVNKLNDPTKYSKRGYLENCEERELGSYNYIKNKDIVEQARPSPPFHEIIDYLNQKAKKNYKYAETSKKHINARWNEGYKLADFKKVIDIKCPEWLDDPKMNSYLRPSTLFGTKFESYLNSKPAPKSRYDNNHRRVEVGTDWSKYKSNMSDEEYAKKHESAMQQLEEFRSKFPNVKK